MPEPVQSDQKYLPGLDGLRALAVTAVVAYHLGYGWAQGGLLGVGVFFTLSGYLITDILVGQFAAKGRMKLKDFWLRRARRLLPALFVMLAVVTVWVNGFARSFVPGYRGDVIASALYVNNWWYIEQHTSYYARFAPPAPLDHLWSLAVEEQFYLVWPWVVLLMVWVAGWTMKKRPRHAAGSSGSAASAARRVDLPQPAGAVGDGRRRAGAGGGVRDRDGLAVPPRLRPDPGVRRNRHAGVRPADRRGGRDRVAHPPGRPRAVGRPAATARRGRRGRARGDRAAGVADQPVLAVHVPRRMALLSVATAVVVAAVATPGGLVGVALGCRPLRWIGVRSYGIYLWHYPIIVLTAAAGSAGNPVSLVRAVAVVAATVVIAALSWKFIEEPIRRGGLRRWSTRTAVGAATADGAPAGGGTRAWQRLGVLGSPLAVGGMCLLAVAGVTAGVTSANAHPNTGGGHHRGDGHGRRGRPTGTALTQSAAASGRRAAARRRRGRPR